MTHLYKSSNLPILILETSFIHCPNFTAAFSNFLFVIITTF